MGKLNVFMKKFLALVLAGSIATVCLTGCDQSEKPVGPSGEQQTQASHTQAPQTESNQEPITISIWVERTAIATLDNTKDLWCFKHLEAWMQEQGYNVKLEVEAVTDTAQQISLALGTNSLPDVVWGIQLSATDAVTYGSEDKIVLEWTPYINEETMPNLYAVLQEHPDALLESTLPDGGISGLPLDITVATSDGMAHNSPSRMSRWSCLQLRRTIVPLLNC